MNGFREIEIEVALASKATIDARCLAAMAGRTHGLKVSRVEPPMRCLSDADDMIDQRGGLTAINTGRMPCKVSGTRGFPCAVITACAGAGAIAVALGLTGLGTWASLPCGHYMATAGAEAWCC